VGDGHCASASALAQFENSFFEIFGILCIGVATRGLQLWNRAAVAALFGELLDSTTADLELVSDQPGIEVVINNPLTDPGDIVLVKLHFTWWLVGEITPTKSLVDTTLPTHEESPFT